MRKLIAILIGFVPTLLLGAYNYLPSVADGEFIPMEGGYYVWSSAAETGWTDPHTNSMRVVYYMQETNATTSYKDSWTNSLDGTPQPSVATGPTSGIDIGNRLDDTSELVTDFDGINDFIQVADDAALKFGTNNFTITAWIKLDADVVNAAIVNKSDWPANWYLFDVDNNFKLHCEVGSSSGNQEIYDSDDDVLSTGIWYHVAMVFDRASLEITGYVNGVDAGGVSSSSGTLLSVDPSNAFMMGDGHSNPFNGQIDDVRIYAEALSQTSVSNIYVETDKITGSNEILLGE